jgi:hypothetical protein
LSGTYGPLNKKFNVSLHLNIQCYVIDYDSQNMPYIYRDRESTNQATTYLSKVACVVRTMEDDTLLSIEDDLKQISNLPTKMTNAKLVLSCELSHKLCFQSHSWIFGRKFKWNWTFTVSLPNLSCPRADTVI